MLKESVRSLKEFNKPYSHKSDHCNGILLIHGFTSTTSSMLWLADYFAAQDLNVEVPTMRGHGTVWKDLRNISWLDWFDDVERGYLELKKRARRIYVLGFSMGGALALHLAEKFPELSGVILVNHALYFKHFKFAIVPFLKYIVPSVRGIGSYIFEQQQTEIAYPRIPVSAVHELTKLLGEAKKKIFLVKQPVLIFRSAYDKTIPKYCADLTLKNIGSENKKLVELKRSGHVAVMDFDKELIGQRSIRFIHELT